MKKFNQSQRPRSHRDSISISDGGTRALSPSMPNNGHVLSIKSSWENRVKPLKVQDDAENVVNPLKVQYDSENRIKPPKVHMKPMDRENAGDITNRPSFNGRHKHKHRPNPNTTTTQRSVKKYTKDNAWVRQNDTDDTTSLSSNSNEHPIETSNSNVSDASSAPSTSSSRFGVSSSAGDHNMDVGLAYRRFGSDYREFVENYSSTSGGFRTGLLDSKLANETVLPHPSSDSLSTLNYSLERLLEDSEEDLDSKEAGGMDVVSDGTFGGIDAKLSKDREQKRKSSRQSQGSSTGVGAVDMDYSIHASEPSEAFVDPLKISSCPSTDHSLVYSIGNTVEPYDLKHCSTSDDHSDTLDPSDLVATTLAECRLLLEMSPPPTPAYHMSFQEKKAPVSVDKVRPAPSRSSVGTTLTSPDNSTASVSHLEKFLKCPCCTEEFTEDGDRRPLHSFACDHIICYECVFRGKFASPMNHTTVPCPRCGECDAFDKSKPVISRSYCSLVKSIEVVKSAKKCGQKTRLDGWDGEREAVPAQIRLFSPSKHPGSSTGNTMALGENEGSMATTADAQMSVVIPTGKELPKEPFTPVSRAEFRFLQRKEKLAQSLEKVNKILERSKMQRDLGLNKKEEDSDENKDDMRTLFESGSCGITDDGDVVDEKSNGLGVFESDPCSGLSSIVRDNEDTVGQDCGFASGVLPCGSEDFSEIHRVLNESLQFDHYNDENIKPVSRNLPSDGDAAKPRETGSVKRIKPELRVDTGNYTPHLIRQNQYLDLKDESSDSYESVDQNLLIESSKPSAATYLNDIFRSNPPYPPPVAFGSLQNGTLSQESSLTDRDGDSQFLLGDSSSSAPGGSSLKQKKYGLNRTPLKEFSADKNRKEQKLTEEHRCPQFLPSLNYSTMQESDEFVGLVQEGESPLCTKKNASEKRFRQNSIGAPNKLFLSWKHPKGARLSSGKTDSQDEGGFGRVKKCEQPNPNPDSKQFDYIERVGSSPHSQQDEEEGPAIQGPTYDFVQHSCSFSPSHDSRTLMGAIITHKPKFRSRVFSKLAFTGKKKNRYARKFR